jgi:hypothetical protein
MGRKNYKQKLEKVKEALKKEGKSCESTPDKELTLPCPSDRRDLTFGPAMPHAPDDAKPAMQAGRQVSFMPMSVPKALPGPGVVPQKVMEGGSGVWPKRGDKNDARNAPKMPIMKGPPKRAEGKRTGAIIWPGKNVKDPYGKPVKRAPEHERQRLIAVAIGRDPNLSKELADWKQKIRCAHGKPPCELKEVPDPRNPESDSGLDVTKYVEMQSSWLTGAITPGVCIVYWFQCEHKKGAVGEDGGPDVKRRVHGPTYSVGQGWLLDDRVLLGDRIERAARLLEMTLDTLFIPPKRWSPGSRTDQTLGWHCCRSVSGMRECGTHDERESSPARTETHDGLVEALNWVVDTETQWGTAGPFWQAARVFHEAIDWI